MDFLPTVGCVYHLEAGGAYGYGSCVYGSGLRGIMEADLASCVRTIREREGDPRDFYLESSPRRCTAQQRYDIESLKEEIRQLHDIGLVIQTYLANLRLYAPSSPSLPDDDSDAALNNEGDVYVYHECEDHDPAVDLWPSESSDGKGLQPQDGSMPARRDVKDEESENLPALPPSPIVGRSTAHVYVDASRQGIGFLFREQWQSWRLKACWWNAMAANIQCAEAVAVELGVRLLVKAGYAGQRIVMYSDNAGVVTAIQRDKTRQFPVGQVVKCIGYLCKIYQLDFSAEWIRGVDNPADAPSRFHIQDGRQRFPYDIEIPRGLRPFIVPYHLPVSGMQI